MVDSLSLLEQYVKKGLLRKAETDTLVQYNYSEFTNNAGLWNSTTLFNRGNIYSKVDGTLIARSLPKFLNWEQLSLIERTYWSNQKVVCATEKMDGCLGIIYNYNGLKYNSRGGFDNYVTDAIKDIISDKYDITLLEDLTQQYTLICEVIHPDTKIIVDYDNKKMLYLITAYNKNNEEVDYNTIQRIGNILNMPYAKRYETTWEELFNNQKNLTYQNEGVVLCLPDPNSNEPYRVKLKTLDYLRIAAAKRMLNKINIWKRMRDDYKGQKTSFQDYLNTLPDELVGLATRFQTEILTDLESYIQNAHKVAEMCKDVENRYLNNWFANQDENMLIYKSAVFNIKNNKPIHSCLIDLVKPMEICGEDYE